MGTSGLTDRPRPRVAVVLNSAAGTAVVAEALHEAFAAHGLEAIFIDNDCGTLPQRVAQATTLNVEAVVAAGGDGTVACVAHAVADTEMPMGILPFGTMNLLAKDLGLPVGDLDACVAVLAKGTIRAIDAADVNGHIYLCASMLGMPARLARFREAGRHGSKLALVARMARAGLRVMTHDAPLRLRLRIGGRSVRVRAASLTITPNAIGEDGRTFARPRLDGGELAIYLVQKLTLGRLVRLAVRLLLGRWRRDPALREARAGSLEILSGRTALRVMNDGEVMLLPPPLRYRIRPGAIRVLVPAA